MCDKAADTHLSTIKFVAEYFKNQEMRNRVVCRQNSVVCDRSNFYYPLVFVLILASDRPVLYRNNAFSTLILSTKKRFFSFFKRDKELR